MRSRTLLIALMFAAGAMHAPGTAVAVAPATPTYDLYFGDLHAHTNYSDGESTPWVAFGAAKEAGADFFATTDHIHYPYGPTSLTPELWAETQAAADFYTDDSFVALASYELWLPEIGELNVFDTDEIYGQAGNPAGRGYDNGLHAGSRRTLPRLYDWLAETDAIGQWNHPWIFGGGASTTPLQEFYSFGFRTAARDRGIGLVEAYNGGSYESSYILALDAGWHVLPAANSDTHTDDWISGSEVRTVLLAEDLTAEDLFTAMRASRGYATQDSDLEIRYTLNGAVMGSVLTPASTYEVAVDIFDPDGATDAVTLVEVVSDGGAVVASQTFDSADVEWRTTVASNTARYYFVRVSTASDASGEKGVTAWTAPVWTDR